MTVFVAVDHCTTECVGIHAAKRATRFEALEPIRQGVRDYCSGFRADAAAGIRLRHDHGSQYMSNDFQAEIAFLGMESSPAFVRQPEGNGCVERFIRTLKEQLLWVRTFRNVEESFAGKRELIQHNAVSDAEEHQRVGTEATFGCLATGTPSLSAGPIATRENEFVCHLLW